MYIGYIIVFMSVYTVAILSLKWCPNVDLMFYMRLLLSIGFGYLLFIPALSMLMDIFICQEEAKGIVFFDIDCNTEWWDQTHIIYLIAVCVSLTLVVPSVMYIRVKFQETNPDLNILIKPNFIVLKSMIIAWMVIFSKIL